MNIKEKAIAKFMKASIALANKRVKVGDSGDYTKEYANFHNAKRAYLASITQDERDLIHACNASEATEFKISITQDERARRLEVLDALFAGLKTKFGKRVLSLKEITATLQKWNNNPRLAKVDDLGPIIEALEEHIK